MSIRKTVHLAIPALAIAMLILTLIPAGVWTSPADDAVYSGFDPNLIYTSSGDGGSVRTTSSAIDMSAPPQTQPAVNLFTTPLRKVHASIDVTISNNNGATEPLRIGVWSAWTSTSQFVVFGPPPLNAIIFERITNGSPGTVLKGGDISESTVIGRYQLGTPYHIVFNIDKPNGLITAAVSGARGIQGHASLTPRESQEMFGSVQLSLGASTSSGAGTSHVGLTNYRLTLPHQRVWASRLADPRAKAILVVLILAGIIATAIASLGWLFRDPKRTTANPKTARRAASPVIVAAIGLYVIGNALLFPLGAHPFDMRDQELFAYVARYYGTDHLFYLPNVVSLAYVWGGVPYGEFAFPYEPVSAYLSTATGWVNSLFAGGGRFAIDSSRLEYLIKSINVLFGLVDAGLIYLILRRIGVSNRWSTIPAAAFLFNPAVWFSMSIWGQTHVISLFFVLAAIYLAEKRLPMWAWMALAAACLTRPQMLVFGLLLGIVFLRKFSWQENAAALSWTVILMFVVISPLTLATSPSLPVDVMLHNFNVQEAGGNNPKLTTVSQGAYSVWPLVTFFASGASSTARAFTPSATTLVGSLTYQVTGQGLTLVALIAIGTTLWIRKETREIPGSYLPFVALGIMSFLMLLTGIVSTHFLLALPLLILCRRWMDPIAFWYVVVVWTVGTLVPMFGDMGVTVTQRDYPLFARENNPVTRFVVGIYGWDRFITVAIVANICVVIWVAILAFRPSALKRAATTSPAV